MILIKVIIQIDVDYLLFMIKVMISADAAAGASTTSSKLSTLQ